MKLRNIERIIRDPYPHWVGNGFNVKQYFPGPEEYNMLERFSPFILMDYNAPYFLRVPLLRPALALTHTVALRP